MAVTPSLLSLPHWPDFAGVAQASLLSLSQLGTPVQWLLAESDHDQQLRILLCRGEGPLRDGNIVAHNPDAHAIAGGLLTTLPLQGQSGAPQSYLGLWRPDDHRDPTDLALLEAKAGLFGALLQQLHRTQGLLAELEQARVDADTDPLTGLLNRRGWNGQLFREEARCQRYGQPCTLLVIDLDDLKQTNDQQGHCAGDRLIRQVGRLLAETVR